MIEKSLMENFQFWLMLATASISATITGLLSFGASWMKNRSDIKSLREHFIRLFTTVIYYLNHFLFAHY